MMNNLDSTNRINQLSPLFIVVFIFYSLYSSLAIGGSYKIVVEGVQISTSLNKHQTKLLKSLDIKGTLEQSINASGIMQLISRDKQDISHIIDEKGFAKTSSAADGKQANFKLYVWDFRLKPEITYFKASASFTKLPLIEQYSRKDFVKFSIKITVLGQKGQKSVVKKATGKAYSDRAVDKKSKYSRPSDKLLNKAMQDAIRQVVNKMIADIEPLSVVNLDQGILFLDRGKDNGFKVGTQFLVYPPAKLIEVGRMGKKRWVYGKNIGTAEITRVFESDAEAKMIQGDFNQVQIGYELRKEK